MNTFKVELREYERGWGSKVSEVKTFSTKDDADKFVKQYNKENNSKKDVPDWYILAIPLY